MFNAQLSSVMTPILDGGLQPSGIQRLMPRAIVHGSHQVQGMQLFHPVHTQTIQHVQAIQRHATRNTITGTLLRANLESHVLELGSAHSFWSLDYSKWKAISTQTWISHTWQHMRQAGLTLRGPIPSLPARREADVHLTDFFFALDTYTADQLDTLQACRMHLRITTLADGCTADGLRIANNTWNGHRLDRSTSYKWRRSYRPGGSSWELWCGALKHLLPPFATHRCLIERNHLDFG